MLHSHPCDTCSVQSNFKETYLGLVGAVVLGLVGAQANRPHMFIINFLYTLYVKHPYKTLRMLHKMKW